MWQSKIKINKYMSRELIYDVATNTEDYYRTNSNNRKEIQKIITKKKQLDKLF